ncbi:hypothetical protein A9G09_00470 [Gilliamella sp. wkB292]|uniref:Trm112 family protein n=1 Tax=unclassified Gilliamella TaxID=2685620 RepID=UPI00080E58C8|nr:Trm112 family protein [Gilliamella apicola]OCG11227.1 hypothetical protein A9G09_00470 [Gilliamella apicola]OCL19356.1 hypothetical protein A9G03_06440 [Gilliamella apicola]
MKTLLLNAIACPKCHGKLQYDKEHNQLICQTDKLVFPVKDGIPVLLETEAMALTQVKFNQE